MAITPRTLTVTDATTLKDLNTFLDGKQAGDKVFGTQSDQINEDGKMVKTTTLYLSPTAGGPNDLKHDRNHSSSYSQRRKTARTAVSDILKNAINKGTDNKDTRFEGNKAFRDDLKTLLSNVVNRKFNLAPRPAEMETHSKVTGKMAFNKTTTYGKDTELDAAAVQNVVKVTKTTTDRAEMIKTSLAKLPSEPELPESENTVVPLLATTVPIEEGSEEKKSFPVLNIQGKDFTADKVLGQGGFGTAVRYKAVDGTAYKVVKFTENFDTPANKLKAADLQEVRQEAITELSNGEKFGKDLDSVLRFDDHVEMKNKTIALIGDLGTHGDVLSFAEKLQDAKTNKLISNHSRRLITLTMTLDTANGLDSIHKKGGIHGDVKPDNQMIDDQGRVKIIDFGLAAQGPKVSLLREQEHAWASASYNSPEATQLWNNREENEIAAVKSAEKRVETIKAELSQLFGMQVSQIAGHEDAFVANFEKLFETAAMQPEADAYSVDAKADMYGVGQGAFALTAGKWVSDQRVARIQKSESVGEAAAKDLAKTRKIELASDPDSHGINSGTGVPFDDHAMVDGTGDPVIDSLLDGLLAPNPANRLSAEELRNHPSMQYEAKQGKPAVGSPEVRNLIIAIASDDVEAIKQAEIALLTAFPDPDPEPEPTTDDAAVDAFLDAPLSTPAALKPSGLPLDVPKATPGFGAVQVSLKRSLESEPAVFKFVKTGHQQDLNFETQLSF